MHHIGANSSPSFEKKKMTKSKTNLVIEGTTLAKAYARFVLTRSRFVRPPAQLVYIKNNLAMSITNLAKQFYKL